MTAREKEPVVVHHPKSTVDSTRHDGGLDHVVGAHNYQVFRANRTHPQDKNYRCYTHNHQPMLAYWKGKFYLQYLAGLHNEHEERTETFLTWSEDGKKWNTPEVIFPAIEYVMWRYSIAHQRVGFYTAPNGRLLTLSFYGIPREGDPNRLPNHGNGIGRAVREIYEDGSLSPIYFFRYMPHCGYTEQNTSHWYPHYNKSEDIGFIGACDALVADKLFHQQMWEEDRYNDDGFFGIHWDESVYATGKALSYWTNPDRSVTGIWKSADASVTADHGETWSEPVSCPTIHKNNAKYWGQRTPDGGYALVYCASESSERTPLVVVTGDDGQNFDDMLVVHGEVPVQRFWGFSRDLGPQYVRGIVEGNGEPPGNAVWVTYSMNKEDIWISRIPIPAKASVVEAVDDNFESKNDRILDSWCLYTGLWTRIGLGEIEGRNCLQLRDQDPYDYARAIRVFPEGRRVTVSFSLFAEGPGELHIDLTDGSGTIAVSLTCKDNELTIAGQSAAFTSSEWHEIDLNIDTEGGICQMKVDGNQLISDIRILNQVESVKRLELRTGPFRMTEPRPFIKHQEPPKESLDLEGADSPVPEAVFSIGHLKIDQS